MNREIAIYNSSRYLIVKIAKAIVNYVEGLVIEDGDYEKRIRKWEKLYITWIFNLNMLDENVDVVLPASLAEIEKFILKDIVYTIIEGNNKRTIANEKRLARAMIALESELKAEIDQLIINANRLPEPIERGPRVMIKGNRLIYKNFTATLGYKLIDNLLEYAGPDSEKKILKSYIWYNALGGGAIHFSIPPAIIELLKPDYQLFGSPFNAELHIPYYSAYPSLDRDFGSIGKFTKDVKLNPGLYTANPPFDETIIEILAEVIDRTLDTVDNTTFVVILPLWSNLKGYETMIASPHYKSNSSFEKFEAKYYNYSTDKMVNITPSYIIVLSNASEYPESSSILDAWKSLR